VDWIKNLNSALKYIERNLEVEIDHTEVAKIANSSKFHFLRVFNILTEKTLGEYIRERRMSLATKEIMSSDQKIIDIAYRYRYETPESFSKAFKRFHGVTPSQAKKSSMILKAAPPLYFSISVKGDNPVDYKVEKKGAFKVVGPSIDVTSKDGENFIKIPQFWQNLIKSGKVEMLGKKAGPLGVMGVCYNYDMTTEEFSYMAGIEGDSFDGMETKVYEVPELTWAVFSGEGPLPDSMQIMWKKIYQEWFPATNYEHDEGPELEIYTSCNPETNENSYEIWIPVKTEKA